MSPKKRVDETDTAAIMSELSESSAFFPPTNAHVDKPASGQTDKPVKPQTEKYTTHLLPATIKAIKRYALDHDMKDYEVAQLAFDRLLAEDKQ